MKAALLAAWALGAAPGMGPTPARADGGRDRIRAAAPVIVLVHGAWADGSSWSKVIGELQEDGYTVVAPAVSLSSLSADAAAVRKFIGDLGVPVLVVGHSYGGAVITGATGGLANVLGLVYVAAFAPDTGESVFGLLAQFPPTPVAGILRPDGPPDDPRTLVYLDRGEFGAVFLQDVPPRRAAVLAAVQRPGAIASGAEPLLGPPAWQTLPTWYQVSSEDRVIHPDGQRFMARRMGAETIELAAGHVSPVSEPEAVASFIELAARAVTAATAP